MITEIALWINVYIVYFTSIASEVNTVNINGRGAPGGERPGPG